MIDSFFDRGSEDMFNGLNTPAARRSCAQQLWGIARRKLDQIDSAQVLDDLRVPPGNRVEALGGHRAGQYSVRLPERYRICFV
jgi:proteic killer suppression protein